MSATPLKYRGLWLALGFGFVLFVIYMSLTPAKPEIGPPPVWKFGHVLAYAWLMLWYAQIYAARSTRIVLGVLFCLMGIALEYLQGLTDYRTFAYTDMLLDAGGVTIGLVLAHTRLQHALALIETALPPRELSREPLK